MVTKGGAPGATGGVEIAVGLPAWLQVARVTPPSGSVAVATSPSP